MIIRPAPVAPIGSGTSSWTRLTALVPVLALLVIIGAAWAGAGPPGGAIGQPLSSVRGSAPDNVGRTTPTASVEVLPRRAFDLPVLSVAELLAARASNKVRRGLVAVGGMLRSDALPLVCPAIRFALSRTFCRRLAALFPDSGAAPAGATAAGPPGSPAPALAGQALPGTPFPAILAVDSWLAPWLTGSVPAVFIGHYEDPRARPCRSDREWCGEDFVVERLAWVAGDWVGSLTVRDPTLPEAEDSSEGGRANELAVRAAARGEQILSQALLGVKLLAVVDPLAAAAAGPDRIGGVWYVRSMARPGSSSGPEVVWVVIDDQSGLVLGYSIAQP